MKAEITNEREQGVAQLSDVNIFCGRLLADDTHDGATIQPSSSVIESYGTAPQPISESGGCVTEAASLSDGPTDRSTDD